MKITLLQQRDLAGRTRHACIARYMKIWTGITVLLFFVFTSVHAENDKAFFWQVSSKDGNSDSAIVYLMGSIHFADSSFYPLRKEIQQAFDYSDHLVVELDIDEVDHAAYNKMLAQRGVFTEGKTIRDVISDETWTQLRQRLRYLNVDYETVKNYKPGVLVLTLSALQVMKMGFEPQLGIDAYFLSRAKASADQSDRNGTAKKIIELETLEQQVNLFLDIPNGELLLKESLYSLDESEIMMADLVRYWKAGDEKQINKLLFEDALTEYPTFGAIYDKLFYDRNLQMALKIDHMLKAKGSYFVVVGSGHLIGEQGIVNKLQTKGYRVKRL